MFFSINYFRSVFFILLILVSGQNLRAQTINNGLKFSTIKEVKLEDGNNFSVILQLENTTNDTINARLGLKIPSAIRSYSQDNLREYQIEFERVEEEKKKYEKEMLLN